MSYTPLNRPLSASIAFEHWQPEVPATDPDTPTLAVPQPHFTDNAFSNEDRIKEGTSFNPEQNRFMAMVRFAWRTLFLPVLAVAYLAFCYTCHFKLVRIDVERISDPSSHLNLIKSGVTSISILYVTLSLLPIYSLISDLKSEEFFRTLSGKRSGTKLSSINAISTPSYGIRDTLITLLRRDASGYFVTALVAALVALATSTLAPAALSVDTILFDGDIVALSLGAITRNSVLDTSNVMNIGKPGPGDTISALSPQSGAVAWAELILKANFSFNTPMVDQTAYIIPTPQNLSLDVRSRWLSDVAVLKPTCEWIAPQAHTAQAGVNFSTVLSAPLRMNLTSKGIGISWIPPDQNSKVQVLSGGWFGSLGTSVTTDGLSIFNLSTMDDLTNGATAWIVSQCTAGCLPAFEAPPVNLTFGSDVNLTHVVDINGNGMDITVLYCSPNTQIETHQISNDGQGVLTVGDKVSTLQGNLHPAQTNLMMSFAFASFDSAGPQTGNNVSSFGNQVQFNFIFGNSTTPIPSELTPIPINQISSSYGRFLTSATKSFVNGALATTFVPARITVTIPIFAASLSHIIASTVLYSLLAAFALGCHFRSHVPQFTFFSIAASLAKSDIPSQLKDSEDSPGLDDGTVTEFSGARVLLEEGHVLRLRV